MDHGTPSAPLRDPVALGDYLSRLAAAHDAVARAAATHQTVLDSKDHWGCVVKRNPVDLTHLGVDYDLIGVSSQPFGEIVNQLATIERLLDALRWAQSNGASEVLECHPSTSRGPADTCSHDLVAASDGTRLVFEVSDVAGESGNANRKMDKDLVTLEGCTCGNAAPVRKLLAVSPQSGRWLQARAVA